MEIKCSYEKLIPISQLIPHPKNSNKHPDRQIELLAKILNYQGWRHPVIVSKLSGYVVAGHGRIDAAKKNGWLEVPVTTQDFADNIQEIAFLISDNKIAELAEHDDNLMIEGIKDLGLEDFELLGLDDFEFESLKEITNTSAELDITAFDNFDHQCPKCGFEWNNDTTT